MGLRLKSGGEGAGAALLTSGAKRRRSARAARPRREHGVYLFGHGADSARVWPTESEGVRGANPSARGRGGSAAGSAGRCGPRAGAGEEPAQSAWKTR